MAIMSGFRKGLGISKNRSDRKRKNIKYHVLHNAFPKDRASFYFAKMLEPFWKH